MILSSSEQELLSKLNYDLNIWDEGMHNTEHLPEAEQYSQWKISVYSLEMVNGHIQCGDWIEGLELCLSEDEVKALTLGWGTDLGGDYTPDSDFFLDISGFFDIYKNIPNTVKDWLLALPPREIQDL